MKIFIANPFGFSEVAHAWYEAELLPVIRRMGHVALDPWRLVEPERVAAVAAMPAGEGRLRAWQLLNLEIGDRNREAIDACDVIFAILDGADVDSGTASEIGYGFGVGKLIYGYRGDFRKSGGNEGCVVNLQVENFIFRSGGRIVRTIADLDILLHEAEKLLVDLRGIGRVMPAAAGA
jgi:nucleoside 2-deoxyribosyltransferase